MILSKGQFVINSFTKTWNRSCDMGLPIQYMEHEYWLMHRIERAKATPEERIHLN
jgi:hypothetical protein